MISIPLYHELHRPQFHFTPARCWTNDPNGLVYYAGEYHLFFQHNPRSVKWGHMTWGHAVSRDLVHWEQLADAIEPDELGTIYSGSAVVDWKNTAGFRTGSEPALIAFYTSAGAHAPVPRPFTQSIAYSTDRGRTWTKYAGNPIVPHLEGHNRDPKVIWHAPAERWIMALYLDQNDYALLASKDTKTWTLLHPLTLPGVSECPDLFELPVDGDPGDTRWVFWGANGGYVLGRFDGRTFIPETPVQHAEQGTNGYAAQTWSDLPAEDGRRIQISWMAGGKYPSMPFNQQMSFPVELTLRRYEDGLFLCRTPVREIERLYGKQHAWEGYTLAAGDRLIPETAHDLFDIRLDCGIGERAKGRKGEGQSGILGLVVRGHAVEYDFGAQTLSCLGKTVPLKPEDGRVKLRLLVDRTSLEVFSHDGRLSMSCCFLPEAADVPVEVYARDGRVELHELRIHELRSIWG